MRRKIRERHLAVLGSILESMKAHAAMKAGLLQARDSTRLPLGDQKKRLIEPSFVPRDYLSLLLYIDAEIEHALMDQYLYAAWSLGGPQVPADKVAMVRGWQEVVLGIAKEEMGHLVTVQNILRMIGAPLNLSRDDYPWDVLFYPFPFKLEPLTLDSLAKYVYAESPANWSGKLADEVRTRVHHETTRPHRVGELFDLMLGLIKDESFIPDSAFRASTYQDQANWDEWGRGYQNGARGNFGHSNMPNTPNVLVMPVRSRTDAIAALTAISEQGEAPRSDDPNESSHFTRFLNIYKEMSACAHENWSPSRNMAVNPWVDPLDSSLAADTHTDKSSTLITHPEARLWALLHNLRYRMLLTYLAHSFTLAGGLVSSGNHAPRGSIINAAFGEMYNLRAITAILQTLPVAPGSDVFAGPPLQMPYTLELPIDEPDKWQLHDDLIEASSRLAEELRPLVAPARRDYLSTLKSTDRGIQDIGRRILEHSINRALA